MIKGKVSGVTGAGWEFKERKLSWGRRRVGGSRKSPEEGGS